MNSRVIHTWVIPDTPLKQIASRLGQFFLETHKPCKLITDNGPEFKNKTLIKKCEEMNIKYVRIAALNPQSNGICEREVGTIKQQLAKGKTILQAVYDYNHIIHSITKRTPVSLLFGIKDASELIALPSREEELLLNREAAYENTKRAKEINKKLVDARQTTTKRYQIGVIIQAKLGGHEKE